MNFTPDYGYASDGSTGYLDTGYVPSTAKWKLFYCRG